jgi:hypothetical protein
MTVQTVLYISFPWYILVCVALAKMKLCPKTNRALLGPVGGLEPSHCTEALVRASWEHLVWRQEMAWSPCPFFGQGLGSKQ